ncbi:cytochrome P450 family protein [Macrophomina phaseolina]|uniref:Cytochrome P450 family protein n=1 Tax=Macrophomina phaseolina TaxID=35725 RepID=A0ABQ8G8U3_9PEZI|nr:cytochrome P450 family protein [Macrophomina phaseolina]
MDSANAPSVVQAVLSRLPPTLLGRAALSGAVLLTGYLVWLTIYRLFISPLARFPGPKIAALTGWYEFYYDVVKQGKYVFKIKELHNKYGPIVRINPHELSIDDGEFYNTLYVAGSVRRTENHHEFVKGLNFEDSHFLTTPHDLHRRRRKPLEPFFSRLGVTKMEPMLHDLAKKLDKRLSELSGTGRVIRLDHAFFAFSGDVITRICTDDAPDFLDDPNFASNWFELVHGVILSIPMMVAFPWLIKVISWIPESVVSWVLPHSDGPKDFEKFARSSIEKAIDDKRNGKEAKADGNRTSLFRHILDSEMPQSELSVDRLVKEAQIIFGAGSVSVARTLDFITFYVLQKPHIRERLQLELKDIMADYPNTFPTWAQIEKLPYLQAVIHEGLRLSYGVMHRLPRVSPDMALQYKDYTIPRGIPVGMSAYMMHTDPNVYEKPFEFIPERWLGDVNPAMRRNYVPFAKGSRSCLGMSLAYGELNVLMAVMFRPGGPNLQLYETNESDITQAHDYLIPLPNLKSKGFRVIVK